MRILCGTFLAAILVCCHVSSAVEIINLGTLGGATSEAEDINNRGQITGISRDASDNFRAFIYENGVMTDLGDLGGDASFGRGINDLGVIVGTADTGSNEQFSHRGVIFQGGTANALLPQHRLSPRAINNDGTITGINFTTNQGFVYANGTLTEIDKMGAYQSSATDVNASGQVVGGIHFWPERRSLAILFDNGITTDLGSLGGDLSYAHGINDFGQIVGSSHDSAGKSHGFIYENGVMSAIPTSGVALDINNRGQVVGMSNPAPSVFRAFLYDNGEVTDLNDLLPENSGWLLRRADAINDHGMIVGEGSFNGESRAFLMTVPEPSVPTSIVIGAAILLTAFRRRPARHA